MSMLVQFPRKKVDFIKHVVFANMFLFHFPNEKSKKKEIGLTDVLFLWLFHVKLISVPATSYI